MTSQSWLEVPTEVVRIRDLVATQDGVYFAPLLQDVEPLFGDPFPHVIRWRGVLYLEDGHHRVVKAALRGAVDVTARVLDVYGDGEEVNSDEVL